MKLEAPPYPRRDYGPWDLVVYCATFIHQRFMANLVNQRITNIPLYCEIAGYRQCREGYEVLKHTAVAHYYLRIVRPGQPMDVLLHCQTRLQELWPEWHIRELGKGGSE